MCSPHLQSGLNDSKVLSQCEQGKGSGGKSVAVRRPRLAVAIVACVSVSSLPISLSLSVSVSASCRGLQSKERKPRYKVTHCRVGRARLLLIIQPFSEGEEQEGEGALQWGLCICYNVYTNI